ncbi:M16 family metallopeptidase [Pseudoroseicyclus tamaricis]|uniref:Insulinase family protein n=1 Tax=Pseudoroseicyclus tamaricis TaxID=2705421 RepID=A0A6B2K726_9RHOB|nr:pitrilysin family protein [Pseudoroseicyclus tamaricis]NDV02756.1 insulinase family protein [Pseudoroseicyclus tamaricis]
MIRALTVTLALIAATPAAAEVEIQELTTPGGIDLWLVEDHSLPFVALEIRAQGGAALDPEGKRGAANLMTGLLEEGSGDMDAGEFQEAREALAATFEFGVYDDTLSISARMLTENRDEAVALLHQALTEPRFDEDAVERVRAQVLAGLDAAQRRPGTLASRRFFANAFPDAPYGSDSDGTVESVSGLTRDDLMQSFQDLLVTDRAYVGAVGDITPEEAEALIDELLEGVPESGPELGGHVDFAAPGGVDLVDFETPQSIAIFGHQGIGWDDPDYFAAIVLNQILGGDGFDTRLMQELREERGLTYGVGTSLYVFDNAEAIVGSFASANATMGEAVGVVKDVWADLAENGVTEAELEAAKTYMTGEYPLRFTGNDEIARIMVGMQMLDLPPDYVIERNSYIEAVTLEDVNRVAARLLQPEDLYFVVAGQPEGLEDNVVGPAEAEEDAAEEGDETAPAE